MTGRRVFLPVSTLQGSPTLETMIRREPSRRYFRQLSSGSSNPTEPAVLDEWLRQYKLSSVLTTDTAVSGYTTPWVYKVLSGGNSSVYDLTVTGAPTIEGSTNPEDRWIRKMQPIRFSLYGPAYGASNILYSDGQKYAYSNYSPPNAGHTQGAVLKSLSFRAQFISRMNTAESKLAYVRFVQNGVNITDPIAVDSRCTDIVDFVNNVRTCRMLVDIPCSVTVSASDFIDVDCWFYASFTRHECGAQLQPDSLNPFIFPWHFRAYIFPTSGTIEYNPYFMLWSGINCNARIGRNDVFKITWGSNPPGGTNPLTLQAQSGWTFQQVSRTSILMTKTSAPSSGDTVFFDYGREIPWIRATMSVSMPGSLRPITRYHPTNSGHYNQAITGHTDGVWYPSSTVFPIMGAATGGSPAWATSPATLATISTMPLTCTIERV